MFANRGSRRLKRLNSDRPTEGIHLSERIRGINADSDEGLRALPTGDNDAGNIRPLISAVLQSFYLFKGISLSTATCR